MSDAAQQTMTTTAVDRIAQATRDIATEVRELQLLVARHVDVIAATDAREAAMHLEALADLLDDVTP